MAGGVKVGRESCTNAKAKYSSSVVSPDPSVHFYHWAGSLLLKNDVQPVTQLPQSRRQVHDVLSAAESVPLCRRFRTPKSHAVP